MAGSTWWRSGGSRAPSTCRIAAAGSIRSPASRPHRPGRGDLGVQGADLSRHGGFVAHAGPALDFRSDRAAAGDVYDTGMLGKVIKSAGKGTVFPLIVKVVEKAGKAGLLVFEDATDAAEIYTTLLIGDLQIQRVIGVRGPLSEKEIKIRTNRAFGIMLRLFGVTEGS